MANRFEHISVIGLGYVGLPTAAVMAAFLSDVVRPGYQAAGWRLRRVLTGNGKEFKASFVMSGPMV